MFQKLFQHVSQSPTNPRQEAPKVVFDVAQLYSGPVTTVDETTEVAKQALDEKLRKAYFWIVNNAIISPHYDIEYHDGAFQTYTFGDQKSKLTLPSGQSYSSFVLMPLLTFGVRGRCLLVGGPGRGKTASAILMGVLAGYSLKEVKRAIQHGQPQMTISDLLGNPLPADLIGAKKTDDISISWRKWLSMRVKIIDEYNRIPTRTQSALLTVLADNYAEIFDQIYECPPAAWYLTANDDAGGGTYQVIEALRDRIDIVVRALHFNSRFLNELLTRIEEDVRPEELVPSEIIFSQQEMDLMAREIRQVELPVELRRRLEFFASQFEFLDVAGERMEYKTKDGAKLSGLEYNLITQKDTGRDKVKDVGTQTRNGLSVRAMLTLLLYVKALAYFRGNKTVSLEDMRHIVPFVLHDKLTPDIQSPFFEVEGNFVYKIDRISWLRRLFDLSCAEYDRLNLDRDDPVVHLEKEFQLGLEGLTEREARSRLVKIERVLSEWSKSRKLYGHVYDDVLKLKYLHQRYTNYIAWAKWKR
ncbi:MAG TPA: AAA family ATPase [Candidatus Obscuribacterales bacterium]